MIQDILHATIIAQLNKYKGNETHYDQLIYKACGTELRSGTTEYECMLNACGFVASLTDSKAMNLFHIINGQTKIT